MASHSKAQKQKRVRKKIDQEMQQMSENRIKTPPFNSISNRNIAAASLGIDFNANVPVIPSIVAGPNGIISAATETPIMPRIPSLSPENIPPVLLTNTYLPQLNLPATSQPASLPPAPAQESAPVQEQNDPELPDGIRQLLESQDEKIQRGLYYLVAMDERDNPIKQSLNSSNKKKNYYQQYHQIYLHYYIH
eukprot:270779_1